MHVHISQPPLSTVETIPPSIISTPGCESNDRGSSDASDEKKQRRRLQNRVSQRKHRSLEKQGQTVNKRPYAIGRWRLEEYEPNPTQSRKKSNGSISNTSLSNTPDFKSVVAASQARCLEKAYKLPADNLLHLVLQHAFQGLYSNKDILSQLAIAFTASSDNEGAEFHTHHSSFPTFSVVFPAATNIPSGLDPTQQQMSQAHQTWIDVLPFPRMRDNLIKWESNFDHAEFVGDIVGNFIDIRSPSRPRNAPAMPAPSRNTVVLCQDGNATLEASSGRGLVLWGEPYLAQSWEATPGFLQKWTWAAEGCEELIRSTNHWRSMRGEGPIELVADE